MDYGWISAYDWCLHVRLTCGAQVFTITGVLAWVGLTMMTPIRRPLTPIQRNMIVPTAPGKRHNLPEYCTSCGRAVIHSGLFGLGCVLWRVIYPIACRGLGIMLTFEFETQGVARASPHGSTGMTRLRPWTIISWPIKHARESLAIPIHIYSSYKMHLVHTPTLEQLDHISV